MRIGIDKGHTVQGGGCHGACGMVKESVVNRLVGDIVIHQLKSLGHEVIDCSCDYANDPNPQLVAIANKANASSLDIFLSLHLNAGGGIGAEIYTTSGSGASTKAKNLINTYCAETGFRNRGYKTANFYVLRNTKAPAMLLEMAFVDTQQDADIINNIGYARIASAIVKGLTGQVASSSKPEQAKPSTPSNTSNDIVEITTGVLNVRSGPGTGYNVVQTVKRGEVFTIVEKSGDWGKLKSGAGWINLNFTKSQFNSYLVKVTASKLNVRKGPSTEYNVSETVSKGDIFTIVEENGKWGKLKSGAGWVHLDYIQRI